MKKSSITLLAALGIMLLFSFFVSAFVFRKVVSLVPLQASGEIITQSFEPFRAIKFVDKAWCYIDVPEDKERPSPYIVILASDSVSTPEIKIDSSWNENLTAELKDSVLTVILDGHTLLSTKDAPSSFPVAPDNIELMKLIVPQQMLDCIKCSMVDIRLRDFRDATLTVDGSISEATDCSFRSLRN